MTVKKYDEAIDAYTKAIALDSVNPVYYSNRAAAYASKGDHASAILDSEKAIEVDPKFVKAYSRLGYVSTIDFYVIRSHSTAPPGTRNTLWETTRLPLPHSRRELSSTPQTPT